MGLKEVLANKKKKRTITTVGTVVIILLIASVFWYQAATIPTEEVPPPPEAGKEEGAAAEKPAEENITHYHDERNGTVPGSGPAVVINESRRNQEYEPFPVKDGAKKLVVEVSSEKDVDLYILDREGNVVGSSATTESTERVEITNPSPAGEWNADILHWSLLPRPFNSADYYLVIDVYYE